MTPQNKAEEQTNTSHRRGTSHTALSSVSLIHLFDSCSDLCSSFTSLDADGKDNQEEGSSVHNADVMLVGCWPDLGLKRGARANFFLTRPTWYAKGTVQSGLDKNLGQREITRVRGSEREDCNNKSRRPRWGISSLCSTGYIPNHD